MKQTKSLSENRHGEGDSPILLPGHRKIGTVPDSFETGSTGAARLALAAFAAQSVKLQWR